MRRSRRSPCGSRMKSWRSAPSKAIPVSSRIWCAAMAAMACGMRARTITSSPCGVYSPAHAGRAWPAWPPRAADGASRVPSVLLESQGLGVLRHEDRYVSLECGPYGGGHGHPDRLHLTLHAGGVHWLPDPGTGSYVARDLFWYRSTLAHNAPRLDGVSQPAGAATCQSFDDQGEWAWMRGRFGGLTRTLVAGTRYLVDVVEMSAGEAHVLELPWHVAGRPDVETPGRWDDAELPDEFVTRVKRFQPDRRDAIVVTHIAGQARLTLHLVFDG